MMQQAWAEEMMMQENAMRNQQMRAGAMGRMMEVRKDMRVGDSWQRA